MTYKKKKKNDYSIQIQPNHKIKSQTFWLSEKKQTYDKKVKETKKKLIDKSYPPKNEKKIENNLRPRKSSEGRMVKSIKTKMERHIVFVKVTSSNISFLVNPYFLLITFLIVLKFLFVTLLASFIHCSYLFKVFNFFF